MPAAFEDIARIEAILFDMNGTLRSRQFHEPTMRAAEIRFLRLTGLPAVPDGFWDELSRRQKAYSAWSKENLRTLTETETITRWILHDLPPQQVGPVASEIMLALGERKGRHVPRDGATRVLHELKRRGYRLGVISNTMSTLDIPRSLESFGWKDYFEVVILSANFRFCKPSPEPFLEAARLLGIPPGSCAYLGNRAAKDIAGCKRAGYRLALLLESPKGSQLDEGDQSPIPDFSIHDLGELLAIFPGRN